MFKYLKNFIVEILIEFFSKIIVCNLFLIV